MPSVQQRVDKYMRNKMGFTMKTRATVIYYGAQFWEQVLAVVPITMCLVVVMFLYFQQTVDSPGQLTGGLIAAMVGLVLFVDGLRVAIMPLGSLLGQQLPEQFKVRYILVVACAIGILCTYAEPAIASLRPLASLVKRCQTPYLFFVLNEMSEVLVLSIGLGVGVAAMIGVLRFLRGWSLKPLIAMSLTPTIACAIYMKWGNPHLAPLIGLAWDCGAVTTGPVTVPILLSLGIGVIKGQKARHDAREFVDERAKQAQGQALEGFGIVTLASTFPILAVEVLSIIISLKYSPDDISTNFGAIDCDTYIQDTTEEAISDQQLILDAFVFAVRSILPLAFFLILMIKLVLRKNLPRTSFEVPPPMGLLEDIPVDSPGLILDLEDGKSQEQQIEDDSIEIKQKYLMQKMEERAKVKMSKQEERVRKRERLQKALTTVGGVDRLGPSDQVAEESKVVRRQHTEEVAVKGRLDLSSRGGVEENGSWIDTIKSQLPLLAGIFESMMGMTLFNIGLLYGFTSLGDQSGLLLPSAFMETKDAENSPYFSYTAGVSIVLSTVWSLGFLATRAEPALRVMGKTVETLSEGQFSQTALVYTVCVGVGFGMVAGSCKILFGVNIIYLILGKYAFAAFLTIFSSENFTNIAWDSAGVTTGPVTVPFVLSIGIGFSKAKNAREGFGILTCASVAPIITVLFTEMLRRFVQSAIYHHQQRRLRRLVSTQTQTETPEDLELLLDSSKGCGGMILHCAGVPCADASTQYDPPPALEKVVSRSSPRLPSTERTTLSWGQHPNSVAEGIATALNKSFAIHHPQGVGGAPMSPRVGREVTTTITVTSVVSPEDVEIFTSQSCC